MSFQGRVVISALRLILKPSLTLGIHHSHSLQQFQLGKITFENFNIVRTFTAKNVFFFIIKFVNLFPNCSAAHACTAAPSQLSHRVVTTAVGKRDGLGVLGSRRLRRGL